MRIGGWARITGSLVFFPRIMCSWMSRVFKGVWWVVGGVGILGVWWSDGSEEVE